MITNPKDTIICLVGKSGSGKTAVAKELEIFGYNIIFSYTTRAPRENEWGRRFATEHDYYLQKKCNNIVADSIFGGQINWITHSQYKDKAVSIFPVDPEGVMKLYKKAEARIVTIFLVADEVNRIGRMLREPNMTNELVQQRIARDADKFDCVACNYIVDNNQDLLVTVKAVRNIIQREVNYICLNNRLATS